MPRDLYTREQLVHCLLASARESLRSSITYPGSRAFYEGVALGQYIAASAAAATVDDFDSPLFEEWKAEVLADLMPEVRA